ncbi:MAG: DinB family protein [Bryobacteraceae bacterium]
MDEALAAVFLDFSIRKLEQYAGRIRDCLDRLSNEQVWRRGCENENAVGNLVLHLCGNLRQWIGHGAGRLPDVRARDAEFAARGGISRRELADRLEAVVREATAIVRELTPARLLESVVLQGYRVKVLEAVYHAVEHFALHAGQIMYATKAMTGADLGYYRHLSGQGERTDPTP